MRIQSVTEAVVPVVRFVTESGEHRQIDVAPLIRGPWYGELANPQYFALAEPCDFGWAIGWPNGQAVAPDDIEEHSEPIVFHEAAEVASWGDITGAFR